MICTDSRLWDDLKVQTLARQLIQDMLVYLSDAQSKIVGNIGELGSGSGLATLVTVWY